METSLVAQGVELMLVGMGTVFAFLTILVFAMLLMSKLLLLIAAPIPASEPTDEEVAAIAAAIAMHRRNDQEKY